MSDTCASTAFDSLGGVLQPTSLTSNSSSTSIHHLNNNNNTQQQQQQTQQSSALITGDLESSLASLAENLTIHNRQPVKSVQWNSPKNGSKISNNWTPQPMAATTGAGYKPMNQSMAMTQQVTMQPQLFPTMQPQLMGMRPMVSPMTNPMLQARPAGMAPASNPMSQQSLLFH